MKNSKVNQNQNSDSEDNIEWLRREPMAKRRKISLSTLDRWKRNGVIPYRKIEGIVEFDPVAVNNALSDPDAPRKGLVIRFAAEKKAVRKRRRGSVRGAVVIRLRAGRG